MDLSALSPFSVVNLALNAAMLVYIIRIEHRFTKLETQMRFVLKESGDDS